MPAEQVWTVKAALDWTSAFLAEKADEHPRRSAEWLLSAATGLSRVELYAYHDRPLTPKSERDRLREAVKRRAAGEPLQYVTGEVAFRHIVVKVRPGVLIPRPETEVLVDSVLPAVDAAIADAWRSARRRRVHRLRLHRARHRAASAAGATVVAGDISPLAVSVAEENASRLGLAERVDRRRGRSARRAARVSCSVASTLW